MLSGVEAERNVLCVPFESLRVQNPSAEVHEATVPFESLRVRNPLAEVLEATVHFGPAEYRFFYRLPYFRKIVTKSLLDVGLLK
jgi:DUF971 family protein